MTVLGADLRMIDNYLGNFAAAVSYADAYYAALLTPELEDELNRAGRVGPVCRRVWKQMGRAQRHPGAASAV